MMALLIPDFAVELRPSNPPYQLTRVATGENITSVDHMSSGEAQLFTIGLDILTIAGMWELNRSPERVLLLDEPDPHIHPDLQGRLADFLVRVVDRFSVQLIVATHSTALMSALAQFGRDAHQLFMSSATGQIMSHKSVTMWLSR
jgi:predicted ATP-dependent endonuclease of OLD family